MTEPLLLYTAFHLNLAYSSIEEEQRAEVISRCYWPLLKLAREQGLPLGIEAPAWTLETAQAIDPGWLAELRDLVQSGQCEFIASGYAQVIGPLVPFEVNEANLRLGNEAYERLLGVRPSLALLNEQAYAAGLVEVYRDAGFSAIVMEWDNPASCHPEWHREWRYFPQMAVDQEGRDLPLLWNKSLAFQQFQRYVHGETRLDEYLAYLSRHAGDRPRAFPLYGNDVEIFDFRPGRYHTEAAHDDDVEWHRIGKLFEALQADDCFRLVRPSAALDLLGATEAGNRLCLESPEHPVPVKKQGKYNLTRWAVTPRDDLAVNTACWRIYERLMAAGGSDEDWRELCYLWGSDFRTHITARRWAAYRKRLAGFEASLGVGVAGLPAPPEPRARTVGRSARATVDRWRITLRSEGALVVLNTRRGLALESLAFADLGDQPVAGTLPHGYYDDISLGADFYTGHLVLEPPGAAKITDLDRVEWQIRETSGGVTVAATLQTALGMLRKTVSLTDDEPTVHLTFDFDWQPVPASAFRLGYVTVIPEAFMRESLYYACHNGGRELERLSLSGASVDHGRPVSSLVSASSGLGVTQGMVLLGDARKTLRVEVDKASAALIGLVTYREVAETFFFRLAFSALELDETCRLADRAQPPGPVRITYAGVPTPM